MLGGWDVAIFRWINDGWASPALDPIFWFFSLGIKGWPLRIFLIGLAVFLLVRGHAHRIAALAAIAAAGLANEMCDLAKWAHFGWRPSADLPDVRILGAALTSSGTISAHSANMAAVAVVFWWRLGPKWGIPWAVVAFLTGLSRIYVGAHYPSQVLFGWTAGITAASIICAAILLIEKRTQKKAG